MNTKIFRKAIKRIEDYAKIMSMDDKVLIVGVENDIIRFDLVKTSKKVLEDGCYSIFWKLWHGTCCPDKEELNVFDTEEGCCQFEKKGYQIGGEYNYTVFND